MSVSKAPTPRLRRSLPPLALAFPLAFPLVLAPLAGAAATERQEATVTAFDNLLGRPGGHGAITGTDTDFVVHGHRLTGHGPSGDATFVAETTSFTNARLAGGLSVERAVSSGIVGTHPIGEVTAATMVLDRLRAPTPASFLYAATPGSLGGIAVDGLGATVSTGKLRIEHLAVGLSDHVDGVPHTIHVEIRHFMADDPSDTRPNPFGLAALDYDLDADIAWIPAEGRLKLTRFRLTLNDFGTLSGSLTLTGATPEVMSRAFTDDTVVANVTTVGASLGVEAAELRYDDASGVSRLLDDVATDAGAGHPPKDEIARRIATRITDALAAAPDEAFAGDVRRAVPSFFADPHALTVRVKPPAAVPITTLVAVGAAAPLKLAPMLALRVEASR